jgi:hypothetical protein
LSCTTRPSVSFSPDCKTSAQEHWKWAGYDLLRSSSCHGMLPIAMLSPLPITVMLPCLLLIAPSPCLPPPHCLSTSQLAAVSATHPPLPHRRLHPFCFAIFVALALQLAAAALVAHPCCYARAIASAPIALPLHFTAAFTAACSCRHTITPATVIFAPQLTILSVSHHHHHAITSAHCCPIALSATYCLVALPIACRPACCSPLHCLTCFPVYCCLLRHPLPVTCHPMLSPLRHTCQQRQS